MHQMNKYILPERYQFDFKKQGLDKKWQNKDIDITDYFNYGFSEDIWKCYATKVRRLYQIRKPDDYLQKIKDNEIDVLKDNCAIDHGGFCPPYDDNKSKAQDQDFLSNRIILLCGYQKFNRYSRTYPNYPIEEFMVHFQKYNENNKAKDIQDFQYSNELQILQKQIEDQNSQYRDIYSIRDSAFNGQANFRNQFNNIQYMPTQNNYKITNNNKSSSKIQGIVLNLESSDKKKQKSSQKDESSKYDKHQKHDQKRDRSYSRERSSKKDKNSKKHKSSKRDRSSRDRSQKKDKSRSPRRQSSKKIDYIDSKKSDYRNEHRQDRRSNDRNFKSRGSFEKRKVIDFKRRSRSRSLDFKKRSDNQRSQNRQEQDKKHYNTNDSYDYKKKSNQNSLTQKNISRSKSPIREQPMKKKTSLTFAQKLNMHLMDDKKSKLL